MEFDEISNIFDETDGKGNEILSINLEFLLRLIQQIQC